MPWLPKQKYSSGMGRKKHLYEKICIVAETVRRQETTRKTFRAICQFICRGMHNLEESNNSTLHLF